MSRLYEITYDKENWNVTEGRNGYKLVNRKTNKNYKFFGDVIGFEQIGDDVFLVHQTDHCNLFTILRYKLYRGSKILEYQKTFTHFDFLSEDKIIFNKDLCLNTVIYSISENCETEDIGHIISPQYHDAHFCKQRTINLIKDNNAVNDYPKYLEVIYRFGSYSYEYLQLILDPETLQVIRPVYSTMRGQKIKLDENLSLEKLVNQENWYVSEIDDFLFKLYCADNTIEASKLIELSE